jgi:hypothetical protein
MTTWSEAHSRSERHAFEAEKAKAAGDLEGARTQYLLAADAERAALDLVGRDKPRTLGITAVSVVALYTKAGATDRAREVAKACLVRPLLPSFAARSLREMLAGLPR